MAKTFLEYLQDKEKDHANLPAAKPLMDFAAQVTEFVGPPAKCDIVLGGIVNYGQEYRGVLIFPPLDYAQNLFRVYISLTNQEVSFHPTGGKLEKNVNDLHARLFTLLELPALVETLQYLKEKARQFRETGRVS